MKPTTAAILALADAVIPGGREALLADLLPMMAKERFFSAEDVAERYHVSLSCVKQWRQSGLIKPSMVITAGTVRYSLLDLKRFEMGRLSRTTKGEK